MALRMKDWEVGEDLREWGWSSATVNKVVKKYKLEDNEFVIIMNNSREFGGSGGQPPKCRLYVVLNGVPFTLIPPVADGQKQYDFQHEFNRWLRCFVKRAGMLEMLEVLDDYDGNYSIRREQRIARR